MNFEKSRQKILIIRFSSYGDIAQALFSVSWLRKNYPRAQIHWLARSDFTGTVGAFTDIDRVWSYDRKQGLAGLRSLLQSLRRENFDCIYDAHCNLRSLIARLYLCYFNPAFLFSSSLLVVRRKERFKRFLLFRLRLNTFPKPFVGAMSFIKPLATRLGPDKIDLLPPLELKNEAQFFPYWKTHPIDEFRGATVAVPSSAWELKNWPAEHWKKLISDHPERKWVVLGGSKDQVCFELERAFPKNVVNLAGRLGWSDSLQILRQAGLVIANDTGALHYADLFATPSIALIGPSAFGFPLRPSSQVAQIELGCRPCTKDGRGRCSQDIYKKCLQNLEPAQVSMRMESRGT